MSYKERELKPLDLTKLGVTKSWNDGFNEQRTKDFNERGQAKADVLEQEAQGPISADPRDRVITQDKLDTVRQRVANSLMLTRVRYAEFGPGKLENKNHRKMGVYHLWFPENDIENYSLRDGNPPGDTDRPPHLKRLNITVDLDEVPLLTWEFFVKFENARRKNLSFNGQKMKPKTSPIWLPNQ